MIQRLSARHRGRECSLRPNSCLFADSIDLPQGTKTITFSGELQGTHSGNVAGQRESGSQAGAAPLRRASLAAIDDQVKAREPDFILARTPYLCWKRTRRIRRAVWPKFSGRATLAAARRARWVLADGCPVLRVHFSFGFARHVGQRTDNICRNVRSSGFTRTLFNIAHLRDGQSCS